MRGSPRDAAAAQAADRGRLLRRLAWVGATSLLVLMLTVAWRRQAALLGSLAETAVRARAGDAAILAAQQAALAARIAVVVQVPGKDRGLSGRALRVERRSGADADELVASDRDSRLAVGGVIALLGAPAVARQEEAISQLVASLPAQRVALAADADVEAVYLALPHARAVSRVPYVGAEQLRVRLGDARLAPWFAREGLGTGAEPPDESAADARVARDPATGTAVLRVDQPAWLHAAAPRAMVIVTVPLRAYLARLTAAASPVYLRVGLVAPDGTVAGAASRAPDTEGFTLAPLPDPVIAAIPSLHTRFVRAGSWFALRLPVDGTRFSAVVAVPVSQVAAETLRRSAPELLLVLACAGVLGVLLRVVRREVVEPSERAVHDLVAAEELAREITDGVPGLAVFKVVRDHAGKVTVEFVSRGVAAVLGVPAAAVAADWELSFEPIAPDEVAAVRASCELALADCAVWQQEFRVRRHDEYRWVRVEARAVRTPKGVEIVGTWRDVSESRMHVERLADAHRRLIELADGVPGAVIQWRVTADGRQEVAFVGNRLPEIAGVGASDLYGGLQALEQVQLAEDVDTVRRARQQAATARAGYAVEYRVMHSGRGLRWLREEAVTHPAAGCVAAFTVHITDVTQQRKEAGELRRAKEEAETATRAKSVFLATMSHEIRTPMTGISGMIEVLGRTVLDADQRQQLATIDDSAATLRRILDDVLDFSRIEAGKMTVEQRPMSIDDVVEATAGLYASAAEEKGVRLHATVDPAVRELVMGDAVRLRQVLGNLLSNAVKFTARGSVRLSVSQTALTETHRVLQFEVTDTGPGIPYELQPRLFAPFERGEHELTTQVGGTGLGLALVRRIVDLMEGTVELRSLPGVGTSVQVRLTCERVQEETSEARIWLGGLRVAVLHDTEIDARHLSAVLEGRGAAVIMVSAAAETVPEGTTADVVVTGPDVPREVHHALRARLAPGITGRTQIVRILVGAGLRPEVRGDGGVTLAPHARRSALLRAVAIAAGRDEPDLPTTTLERGLPASHRAATVEEAVAERRLILVCEDHPIAQRVIERQLRALGYSAELHPNGSSGLVAWRTHRYGLVLTDLQMPEMDGLTLARRIRHEEQLDGTLGRTPIIALSGNAFDEQRVVCVDAGMDDFLAKPTLLKELDATLRFWLPPAARPEGDDPTSAPSSALPVTLPAPLSHRALHESLGDDPDVLREALGEFLEADAADVATLQAANDAEDRTRVVSTAHRIEGAARMLGALPYARAAERVKRLFGLDREPAELDDALQSLLHESERLRTWLHTTRDWAERLAAGVAS